MLSLKGWHSCCLVLVPLLLITSIADGADAPAKADRSRDEAAILKSIASYVEAYNKGDAKAVATHWSDSGEWTSPSGERRVGLAAIEAGLREMFADRAGSTIEVLEPSVRLLSDDAAVERGTVIVRTPDEQPERSTYVAVHVKRGSDWKLDSVYETASAEESASASSPLEDLAKLVGQWSDSDADSDVGADIFWLKNKSFLNYSFHVSVPGSDDLEGTQVVGWDPATESIRSWMFDSDGGRGEGVWTKNRDGWTVKLQQTLPDGQRALSTNIYTFVDDDTLLWRSIGRKIDDKYLPNIDDVKLTRRRAMAAADSEAPALSARAKK